MLDATVVIATCNRSTALKATLQSLLRQQTPEAFTWEALVVDNNSTDDTKAVVESFARASDGRIRYLFEPLPGETVARNAAIAEAAGEVIAFTDDDVTLDPCWLANLVCGLRRSGRAAAGGVVGSFNLGDRPRVMTEGHPQGANLAIRASVLARLGGFRAVHDSLVGSGRRAEISEMCARLLNAGEQIVYLPDAIVA
jgi:glycosyltransferase involved in cell wall biosynthesis